MMIILLRRAKRVLCSLGLTSLVAMIPPIDSASKELQFGSTIVEFGKKWWFLLLLLLLMLVVAICPPHGEQHYGKIVEFRTGASINEWRAMSSLRNGFRNWNWSMVCQFGRLAIIVADSVCQILCLQSVLGTRVRAWHWIRCIVRKIFYIAESSFRNLRVFEKTIWTLVGIYLARYSR